MISTHNTNFIFLGSILDKLGAKYPKNDLSFFKVIYRNSRNSHSNNYPDFCLKLLFVGVQVPQKYLNYFHSDVWGMENNKK